MSKTTEILLEKQTKIQELLKALENCPEKDIVWIVNELQSLGYKFYYD